MPASTFFVTVCGWSWTSFSEKSRQKRRETGLNELGSAYLAICGKDFAVGTTMQALYCSVARDGDQIFVAVPENKTVEFYRYLRGFGFCFTIDCRGFCEDNVFSFLEGENIDRLNAIIAKFPLN